jgi:hypothetical protein
MQSGIASKETSEILSQTLVLLVAYMMWLAYLHAFEKPPTRG